MRWYQYTITPPDPDAPIRGGLMKGPDIPDIIEALQEGGHALEGESIDVKPWDLTPEVTHDRP